MTRTPPSPFEGFTMTVPYLAKNDQNVRPLIGAVFGSAETTAPDPLSTLYFAHFNRLVPTSAASYGKWTTIISPLIAFFYIYALSKGSLWTDNYYWKSRVSIEIRVRQKKNTPLSNSFERLEISVLWKNACTYGSSWESFHK